MYYLLTMNRRKFLKFLGFSGASFPFIKKLNFSDVPTPELDVISKATLTPDTPENSFDITGEISGFDGQLTIKMGRQILAESKNFMIEFEQEKINSSWITPEIAYRAGKRIAKITANKLALKTNNLIKNPKKFFYPPLSLRFSIRTKDHKFNIMGQSWLQSISQYTNSLLCDAQFIIPNPKIKCF